MGLICPGSYCTCQENTYFVPASLIFICNLCIIFNIDHPLDLQALTAPYGFYKLPKQLKLPTHAPVSLHFDCCNMLSSGLKEHSLTVLASTRIPLQSAFFQLITLTWHPWCFHLPAPPFLQWQPEIAPLHFPRPQRLPPPHYYGEFSSHYCSALLRSTSTIHLQDFKVHAPVFPPLASCTLW